MITSDMQPIQNLRVLQYLGADRKAEWGKHWIETGFRGQTILLRYNSYPEYIYKEVMKRSFYVTSYAIVTIYSGCPKVITVIYNSHPMVIYRLYRDQLL